MLAASLSNPAHATTLSSPRILTLTFRLSWPPVVETRHSQSPVSAFVRCRTSNSQVICFGSMMVLMTCSTEGAVSPSAQPLAQPHISLTLPSSPRYS